jgi:plasmid stabilization system protein ParE
MTGIRLTNRALADIDAVERYSVETWGRQVADQYLVDLGDALGRLSEDLSLFRSRADYAGRLRFYAIRQHVIIGDVLTTSDTSRGVGYVLAVWHGTMDFIDRLPKLEPDLMHEAELLARRITAED